MDNLERLEKLLSKPYGSEYFFRKLDRTDFFDWVANKIKAFDSIPEPRPSTDGYIEHPPWFPGVYLAKVASKIPKKVFPVLLKVKTENRFALDFCAQAILNMPDDYLTAKHAEIIRLFDRWLDFKHVGRLLDKSQELLGRYIKMGCLEAAFACLDMLSKTKDVPPSDFDSRYAADAYEEIVKTYFPKLAEGDWEKAIGIIESNLRREITRLKKAAGRNDTLISCRRASIEDSPQNWRHDTKRDIFINTLRDTLCGMLNTAPQKVRPFVEKYLMDENLIFRRLAIHVIRLSKWDDLASPLLKKRDLLLEDTIYHEYYKLVQDKFRLLSQADKKQFIEWIMAGASLESSGDKEKVNRYWQAHRFSMIKEFLKQDEDIAEYKYLLDDYRKEIESLECPDFLAYHSSWIRPNAVLDAEQIGETGPEVFIERLKKELKPPYGRMVPTPSGQARILEAAAKSEPDAYASITSKLADEQIRPAYLTWLVSGLRDALKEGKQFELEPVIQFIENPIKYHAEPKEDAHDVGRYSWLRGEIADFIETLVSKYTQPLSENIMDRLQQILEDLINKDENPTPNDEKLYGPDGDNTDYINYCINCNRGKAMHALIQHALRRARMRPEEEKQKEIGQGPFPTGERMEQYKNFLKERLDKELSPSVQSAYGFFLVPLFYLDQEWVKKVKDQGKLLPNTGKKQKFWEAHWQGYIAYSNFYYALWDLLQSDYNLAIDRLTGSNKKSTRAKHYDQRLSEHIMIAYWRGLVSIGDASGLLEKFFSKAPSELRMHAIQFLEGGLKDPEMPEESADWKRLRALWEYRVKKAKDEELVGFISWLENCPDKFSDIIGLIIPSIQYLDRGRLNFELLKYLDRQAEQYPDQTLKVMNELLQPAKFAKQIAFNCDKVSSILNKVSKSKQIPAVAKGIRKAVNRLGELGFYDFRDLLT